MAGEIVVGLDVGTTKICTVVAEALPDGEANIIGYGNVPCAGLRKGLVVDMDATAAAIRESTEAAARMSKVDIRSVTVGVTGRHVRSLNSRGSVAITSPSLGITEDDRQQVLLKARELVHPPDQTILHVIPRQYIVDGHGEVRNPVGMSGSRLEVECHVVTAARSFVENVVKCVRQAGLELDDGEDGVVLEAVATAEAVLTDDEKRLGVVLADIGGGTTDVAVFTDGAIYHSSVIPVGGEHVTNDIAIGLRLPHPEAVRVKLEYGLAISDLADPEELIEVHQVGSGTPTVLFRRILGEIIEPRMVELFKRGIRAEVQACGREGLLPAGIVLTGGASLLPGAVDLASRELGMPARLGLPRCQGELSEVLNGPQYATAVGLAKIAARRHALGPEPQDTGLLSSLGRALGAFLRAVLGRKVRRGSRRRS
ncbi:MAG: cell division protein FtsA [Armatimonadota bacterium]